MATDKLEQFIRRRLNSVNGNACERVSLLHLIEGRPPQSLLMRKVAREELEDEIVSLTEEIRDTAQNHAGGASRSQRYQVTAFAAQSEVIATYTFRLRPNPDTVDPGESEPATPTGALGLSMRLTESFAAMMVRSMGGIMSQQSDTIARLLERNTELERKHTETISAYEDLMDRKQERDIELFKSSRHEERKDRLLAQGEKVVIPAILDRLTGRAPLRDLLQTLSNEQQQAIFSTLRAEQLDALFKLLKDPTEPEAEGGNDANNGQ